VCFEVLLCVVGLNVADHEPKEGFVQADVDDLSAVGLARVQREHGPLYGEHRGREVRIGIGGNSGGPSGNPF
jgi:hypothetical protein